MVFSNHYVVQTHGHISNNKPACSQLCVLLSSPGDGSLAVLCTGLEMMGALIPAGTLEGNSPGTEGHQPGADLPLTKFCRVSQPGSVEFNINCEINTPHTQRPITGGSPHTGVRYLTLGGALTHQENRTGLKGLDFNFQKLKEEKK